MSTKHTITHFASTDGHDECMFSCSCGWFTRSFHHSEGKKLRDLHLLTEVKPREDS